MPEYDYHRPTRLEQVWQLVAEHPGAALVAGGTDLFVQLRKRRRPEPPAVISLRRVAELTAIETAGEVVRIGAAVPLAEVAAHPAVRELLPALVESIRALGSPQIRNVATLGGNLCNASPAADTAPPLLVHEARVEVAGPDGARQVPIDAFFTGPGRCALAAGEVVTAIAIDAPAPETRAVFLRRGRVKMDLAVASVAVRIDRDGDRCALARVAAGAVAPTPRRLAAVEEALAGATLDDDTIERARALASAAVEPITDLRSTAEYRRTLVGVFVARGLRALRDGEEG